MTLVEKSRSLAGADADPGREGIWIDVSAAVANRFAIVSVELDRDTIQDTPERATLHRYDATDGEWSALETRVVEEADGVVRFEADTPGFSLVAVTEQTESQVTDETGRETSSPSSQTTMSGPATDPNTGVPETTATSGQPGFDVVAAALAVLAAVLAVRRRD